jgi:hypothetical protein
MLFRANCFSVCFFLFSSLSFRSIGNRISHVRNLTSLISLTELNLRRNVITNIDGLEKLPSLQRVFLSHNAIEALYNISCVFQITYLIELSMDGNPVAEVDPVKYRNQIIAHIPSLKHLDLKRITDEERALAIKSLNDLAADNAFPPHLQIFKESQGSSNRLGNGSSPLTLPSLPLSAGGTLAVEDLDGEGEKTAKKVSLLSLHSSGSNFVLPDSSSPLLASKSFLASNTSSSDRLIDGNSSGLSGGIGGAFGVARSLLSNSFQLQASSNADEEGGMLLKKSFAGLSGQQANNHSILPSVNNPNSSGPTSPVAHHLGSLVALAKAGRISKAQNLFDIEVLI